MGGFMSFGNKLFQIRTEKNLSQEMLAEKVDVSVQTIHRWEHDKSAPNVNQLKCLCEIFGVTANYFFEELDTQTLESQESALTIVEQKQPMKTESVQMLFVNKWYYWIALIPWFLLFFYSFESSFTIVFFLVVCLIWTIFTAIQEILHRNRHVHMKKGQLVLSFVKTIGLIACSIVNVCLAETWLWKIIFLFVGCMCIAGFLLEGFIINDEYTEHKSNIS